MTIIAAVDDTDTAKRVMQEAAYLATNLNEELHVLHATDYSELKRNADGNTETDRRTVRQQARDTAARIASTVTEEFHPVGLIGRPAAEVVSYADSEDTRYLVIGGTRRSPAGKAVFGSATQSILLNASCPVVTVLSDDE